MVGQRGYTDWLWWDSKLTKPRLDEGCRGPETGEFQVSQRRVFACYAVCKAAQRSLRLDGTYFISVRHCWRLLRRPLVVLVLPYQVFLMLTVVGLNSVCRR